MRVFFSLSLSLSLTHTHSISLLVTQIDKGFYGLSQFLPNVNRELVPRMKRKREQYQPGEIQHGRTESKNRYTCEVRYHNVVDQAELIARRVRREHFVHLNDAVHIGHFGAQLYGPNRKPAQWSERDAIVCDGPPPLFDLQGNRVATRACDARI